jgi:hypothetical protein
MAISCRLDRARLPRPRQVIRVGSVAGLVLLSVPLSYQSPADGAQAAVGLGTSAAYSVLGGQTVTNTGPTTLSGDLGVSPGTAITGFPPGTAFGATHAGDAPAAQAQSDLTSAYTDAAGRSPTANVTGDLVGRTLTAGVYSSSGPLSLSGTLTLDGQGDPSSVFIFQAASTLITASASHVSLINDAQPCNVFWQVGSSATLGTASSFVGTVMALTSISVTTSATVTGRALARNGQVSLDDNTFTAPACAGTPPTTTTSTTASTTTTTASTSTTTTQPTTTTTKPGPGPIAVPTTSTTVKTGSPSTTAVPGTGTAGSTPGAGSTVGSGTATATGLSSVPSGPGSGSAVPSPSSAGGSALAFTGVGSTMTALMRLAVALLALGIVLAVAARPRR